MSYLSGRIIWTGGNFSQHMKNFHDADKDKINLFKSDSHQLEYKHSVAILDNHVIAKEKYDKKILSSILRSLHVKQQWVKRKQMLKPPGWEGPDHTGNYGLISKAYE